MLFKVAGSANPVNATDVHIVGDDEVTGQVTSGQFCQTGTLVHALLRGLVQPAFRQRGDVERQIGSRRAPLSARRRLAAPT